MAKNYRKGNISNDINALLIAIVYNYRGLPRKIKEDTILTLIYVGIIRPQKLNLVILSQ